MRSSVMRFSDRMMWGGPSEMYSGPRLLARRTMQVSGTVSGR